MLTLVPTPIGNLEDMSKRALDALVSAELIFCEDTRVTKKLLNLLSKKFNLTFSYDDFRSFHSHNQEQVLKTLSPKDFEKNIVYVSDAGMPCVSDPGALLVEYAIQNNLEYDVIPGANAVITAFAMSGFESSSFTFFGFLDHKGNTRKDKLQKAMNNEYLSILYESPHRLLKLLEEIKNIDENRTVFLAKEISKKYQNIYKNSAKNIYEELKNTQIKGEWVVIIENIEKTGENLSLNDIKNLDIPPKTKAKLLSKMTGRTTKELYQEILDKI